MGQKYLIQYREFLPSIVSNFELFVHNGNEDSADSFHKFSEYETNNYATFMKRWATAERANSIFVRIAYERLTTSPLETLESVVSLFAPGEPLDRGKLAHLIETADRVTVKKLPRCWDTQLRWSLGGVEVPELEKGVHASREIRSFRYYDEALFRWLDEQNRLAYETMANLPIIRDLSEA